MADLEAYKLYCQQRAPAAIRNFLANFPDLEQPTVRDLNSHPASPSPSEKYGTVLLPLWSQTLDLHAGKPYFNAFKDLITTLTPILSIMAGAFKASFGPESVALHGRALHAYQNYIANPDLMFPTIFPAGQTEAFNCFQSMRLSANLALERTRLDAGDGSRWAVLVGFGAGNPRVYLSPGNLTKQLTGGGTLVMRAGIAVHTSSYVGEWYMLELFLPRLAGELGEAQEEILEEVEIVEGNGEE